MTQRAVLELSIGERLELRKQHPCGGRSWEVVRLGADIGLVCEGCGHRVLMERRDVERQLRRRLDSAPPSPSERPRTPPAAERTRRP